MDISVLIPVYNVEKYICRCLQSIASQTLSDSVECIIVDDCGTDSSMNFVQDFIDNYKGNIVFKVVHHDVNRGLASARNTALFNSTGKYILHIDSDDYCEPTMLEDYIKVANATNADVVISDFWYTYADHEEYCKQNLALAKDEIVNDLLNHRLFTVNWNKFIKKSLYDKSNIRYNDGANYGEDISVCIPLLLYSERIEYINKAYVHYVQYNVSAYNYIMSKKSYQDYIDNLKIVHNTIKNAGLYEACKVSLLNKELSLSLQLLLHSRGSLQKKWAAAFPEAQLFVFKSKISFIKKVALWFSFNHFFFPIRLLRSVLALRTGKDFLVYS